MRTIIFTLALSLLATSAFAGGMSVEKCEEMGTMDFTCYVCSTGQKLGMASAPAKYDPVNGDCADLQAGLKKCKAFYSNDLPPNTIMAAKFVQWVGGTKAYGHNPDWCKK